MVLPTSERKLNVRWQPPLAINLKELAGELSATIQMVDSDKKAISALMSLIRQMKSAQEYGKDANRMVFRIRRRQLSHRQRWLSMLSRFSNFPHEARL